RKLASPTTSKKVLAGYVLVLLAAAFLSRRIEVDTSFKRNFAAGDVVRRDDDVLNRLLAGTNLLIFTIEGPRENAIAEPTALRAIDRFQRRIEELPGVGKTLSIVDTLKRLHHALNPERPDGEIPESQDLATQYLFLYTLSGGNDLSTRLTAD